MNITKRDVKFFILGIISLLIFEIIYDWKRIEQGFNRGWHDGAYKN